MRAFAPVLVTRGSRRCHEDALRRFDFRAHRAPLCPYEGRPNDYDILVMTEEELYTHGLKAHLAGWQIGTHANGDVGIDTTLRAYERESPRRDPRFRPEHCTVVNDGLIARASQEPE